MAKQKNKSAFVGLKVTSEQAETLARLQRTLKSGTKTEVLLKGLELLAARTADASPPQPREILSPAPELAASDELERLESQALRYLSDLQETRNRSEEVMRRMVKNIAQTDKIITRYGSDRNYLIQILLDIQRDNRWLPRDALMWVSEKLDIPLSRIYHIATFYKAFSLVPQGRHQVSVCLGTACHVRGAPRLLEKVADSLQIRPGETSRDLKFSLNTVNCLGCCALGPVMVVDEAYHSNPTTAEMADIFAACD
jgi:NADH-quinone oxidoreductase subunit E